MAIENPEAIRFTNESVRTLCEKIRSMKAEIDATMLQWHGGGIGAVVLDDMAGIVEDGREAEGVSRLTGNDVVGAVGQFEAIQTALNVAGVMNVISKPCVRTLKVS